MPFSFPKLTATMQGPGNLCCRQVQAATGMAGVLSHPGGRGEGHRVVGPVWAPSSEPPRGCQCELCHHPPLGMDAHRDVSGLLLTFA